MLVLIVTPTCRVHIYGCFFGCNLTAFLFSRSGHFFLMLLVGFYDLNALKAGEKHGKGTDETETIRKYIAKMITPDNNPDGATPEAYGCVKVDAELAALLQKLMNANSFQNVTNSWTKLCYFYEYYGPVSTDSVD